MRRILPVFVFALLLAVLVGFVVRTVDRGPFQRGLVGNELSYWSAAGQTGSPTSTPPLYSRFIAFLYTTDPAAISGVRRTLTALLLPVFAILVFALAWRHAGGWAALLAGGGAALVAPAVLSAGSLGPTMPATILALLALLFLDGERSLLSWILAGVLIAGTTLLLPLLGWCLVAVLGVLAWRAPGRPRRNRAVGAFVATWLVVALLGHGAHASRYYPPLVNGLEFHRGHAMAASGIDPARNLGDSRRWWNTTDYLREGSLAENRKLTPREAGAYWIRQAIRDMVSSPLRELSRIRVKLLAVFQGDPLPLGVSAAFLLDRTEKPGLAVSVWVGRLLLPLGLAGLILARRRAGGILFAAAASGLLAALLTYADADVRLVTVAALLVGTSLLLRVLIEAPWRGRLVALGGSAAAVAVWGFWPVHGGVPDLGISGFDYYYLGSLYDIEGRGSAALREYERSLRLDGRNPYARLALANMLARDNVDTEAIKELEILRQTHPRFLPGRVTLAHLYERQQRWGDAIPVYRELMDLDPWNPEYPNNLGTNLVQLGYFDQAAVALEQAIRVDPTYDTAQSNLKGLQERGLVPGRITGEDPIQDAQQQIILLLREGDFPAARAALDSAYARHGSGVWGFRFLEGTYFLTLGDPAQAVEIFESLRAGHENDVAFLHNLATAYAGTGQLERARDQWKHALELHPSNQPIRSALLAVEAAIDSIQGR